MSSNTVLQKDGNELVAEKPQQGQDFPFYMEHDNKKFLTYTSNTIYPIYAYMFNMTNKGTVKYDEKILFDDVITYMKLYSSSLWSDFYEEERFTPWLKINNFFFEYAFFNNDIFVHWDPEEEKYEVYIKLGTIGPHLKDDGKYLNVQTGLTEFFSDPEIDLVKFNLVGRQEDRYKLWFRFTYKHLVREYIRDSQTILFNKRCYIKKELLENASEEHIESLERCLKNLSVSIPTENKIKVFDFFTNDIIPATDLDLYASCMYKIFDRDISELGRVANLNPKQERHTTAEDYIAVDQNADFKRSIQDQLDLMTGEMEERSWPPLVFKVNTNKSLGMMEEEPEGSEVPKQQDAVPPNV